MLWHKLRRDLIENLGANLACIIIITIGIMAFNAFHMAVDNLDLARLRYYEDCRFADGFAAVQEMPASELYRLEEIPGILQVQGHLRRDITVLMPEWGKNLTLRLVGIEPDNPGALNRVIQTQGPGIKAQSKEVLLGKGFMAAHGIKAGDSFDILSGGKKHRLIVAGSGQSPEFIYLVPDEGSFFTDTALFDVAFIDSQAMQALTGQEGIVNEIAFRLQPGSDYEAMAGRVEEILQPYGLKQLVAAEDQISNFMLNQEIDGVRMMANSLPALFILIAVFILYLLLRRMVEQQRLQIGTMKAFGLSDLAIVTHYVLYGGVLGLLGGFLGTSSGVLLSGAMTQLYGQYFNLPNLLNQLSWQYSLRGMLLAVLPCMGAAFAGSVSVLKLEPAQAMQPPVPKVIKNVFLERIQWLWQSLSMLSRMAVRNIFRSRGRSFFILLGTMFAFSLLWIVFSFNLLVDLMILNEVKVAQNYGLKITLTQPQEVLELKNSLEDMAGVELAEPMLQIGVRLRHGYRWEETTITGMPQNARLYEILDKGEQQVKIAQEGILLSKQIAYKLDVQPGQLIYVDSPLLKEPAQVYVQGIVEQYFGLGNYMNLQALGTLLQTGEAANVGLIKVAGGEEAIGALEEKLLLASGVAAVENKETVYNMYQTLMEPMSASIAGLVFISIVTAFAVIYASATVSLSERQREISSAKVLGMTDQEIIFSLLIENGILTLFGIIFGMPLAKGLMLAMKQAYTTDLYVLPAKLDATGLFYSMTALAAALCLALWTLKGKISRLEIVAVLKSKD